MAGEPAWPDGAGRAGQFGAGCGSAGDLDNEQFM